MVQSNLPPLLGDEKEEKKMSYDKNGIMPECSKCGSPICEHLRESTLLEENARLREIVRKQHKFLIKIKKAIPIPLPEDEKDPEYKEFIAAIKAGHVYLPEPIANPWVETLISEVITFTGKSGEINDQVDTLSQAINYFEEQHRGTDNLSKLGTM